MIRLVKNNYNKEDFTTQGLDAIYNFKELNYTQKAVVFKYKDYENAKVESFEYNEDIDEESMHHGDILDILIEDFKKNGGNIDDLNNNDYGFAAFSVMDNIAFLEGCNNISEVEAANILKKYTNIEKIYDDVYKDMKLEAPYNDIERLAKKL